VEWHSSQRAFTKHLASPVQLFELTGGRGRGAFDPLVAHLQHDAQPILGGSSRGGLLGEGRRRRSGRSSTNQRLCCRRRNFRRFLGIKYRKKACGAADGAAAVVAVEERRSSAERNGRSESKEGAYTSGARRARLLAIGVGPAGVGSIGVGPVAFWSSSLPDWAPKKEASQTVQMWAGNQVSASYTIIFRLFGRAFG